MIGLVRPRMLRWLTQAVFLQRLLKEIVRGFLYRSFGFPLLIERFDFSWVQRFTVVRQLVHAFVKVSCNEFSVTAVAWIIPVAYRRITDINLINDSKFRCFFKVMAVLSRLCYFGSVNPLAFSTKPAGLWPKPVCFPSPRSCLAMLAKSMSFCTISGCFSARFWLSPMSFSKSKS